MSTAGRVHRPAKRRAPNPPSPSLGLTRRRYRESSREEGRDSPSSSADRNITTAVDDNGAAFDSQLQAMVVSTAGSLDRTVPSTERCFAAVSSRTEKHARQKKLLTHRKDRRSLNVQRALLADADGDRPLHLAVVHRDAVLVRQICAMLHSVQAPLDHSNYMRQTPLHLAVILREPFLVEVLLEEGCSLTPRDSRGNTPLHLAASHGTAHCLTTILRCSPQQAHAVINERNFEGRTSLHLAVAESNAEIVRALVDAGCDVDIGDGKSGRSALMHAVYKRDFAMVRVLLQCGASPDAQDYAGNCGHTAACETDEAMADLLATKVSTRKQS